MHFKFHVLVAMLLSSKANARCYNSGMTWYDIGSTMDVDNAFGRICDDVKEMTLRIDETVSGCENVGDDSVDYSIKVYEYEDAVDGSFQLKYGHCVGFLGAVQTTCSTDKDLSLDGLMGNQGGQIDSDKVEGKKAIVKADPQQGHCD